VSVDYSINKCFHSIMADIGINDWFGNK